MSSSSAQHRARAGSMQQNCRTTLTVSTPRVAAHAARQISLHRCNCATRVALDPHPPWQRMRRQQEPNRAPVVRRQRSRARTAARGSGTELETSRSDADSAQQELSKRLSAPSAEHHSFDAASQTQSHNGAPPAHGNSSGGSRSSSSSSDNGSTPSSGGDGGKAPSRRDRRHGDRGEQASDGHGQDRFEQPPEAGIVSDAELQHALSSSRLGQAPRAIVTDSTLSADPAKQGPNLFLPSEQSQIKESWRKIMRWSKVFNRNDSSVLESTRKVVIFGGGSFGTAVGAALARQKSDLDVTMLLRDPYVCKDINSLHCNRRYLEEFTLPENVKATTSMVEAIADAQFAVHAVPVQHSRRFLEGIKGVLPSDVAIISVSKGLEVATGQMMSEIIPSALQRKQPAVFLSGPSFAREVMDLRPTVVVAASKDPKLARQVQQLLAGPYMRVNTSTDVTGVEICGALKNVLAIAAGIVQGLDLGNNAMAALLSQGCAEIRWLAEKMGAKPATVSGLSGLGDIMLTCYGALSRNRSVGIRLGQGQALDDILASSTQVAEGVSTAAAVVGLGRKYRVALPVLTAVAQVLDGNLSAKEVVYEIMNLPQINEC